MKKQIGILLFLFLLAGHAFSQTTEIRKKQFNLEKAGLAIQGYDPVAYFTSHKALEGKKEISAVYNGTTYRFITRQNRDEFTKNPARYEPQYGGWCA